jgi:4-hydroxy-tetrahydrodipicolinate synthase
MLPQWAGAEEDEIDGIVRRMHADEAHAGGDVERAHDLFDAYLPLSRYEQQAGIGLAVRKHLLAQRGVIASAAIRKPGPKLSSADLADLDRLVKRQTRRLAEIG